MLVKISVDDIRTRRAMKKAEKWLSKAQVKRATKKSARKTMEFLKKGITRNKGRYTGRVKNGIALIQRAGGASVKIANPEKAQIYEYFDKGTKAYSMAGNRLMFIPLNRKTTLSPKGGKLKFGKDFVLAKKRKGQNADKHTKKALKFARKDWAREINALVKKLRGGGVGWRIFNWAFRR